MEMIPGNSYPRILNRRNPDGTGSTMHVRNKKDLDEAIREGWSEQHVHIDYPKSIATGRMVKVNPVTGQPARPKDGLDEKTGAVIHDCYEIREKAVVNSAAEEKALRDKMAAKSTKAA